MSNFTAPRSVRRSAIAAIILLAVCWYGASPASAAPGDAAATGIEASLDVEVAPDTSLTIDETVGAITAPPSGSTNLGGGAAQLGTPGDATVGSSAVSSEVVSNAVEASAVSEVADAQINVPALTPLIGATLVDASRVRAEAICRVGEAPTASVDDIADLTVAGEDVNLDDDGEATVDVETAGGVVIGQIDLTIDETTTTTDTASATALQLDISVDLVDVASISGSVTIAQASCETPTAVAPTANTIDPDQGPTAGGTEVTITGSDFVPGETTVDIADDTIPADQVTVAGDGTSLTFTTPPNPAGTVDVTATTPNGTTDPLDFTYIPPAVAPTTMDLNPDQGPTAGGTEVTINGSDFIPGSTQVNIADDTVDADTVDADGTSLTFTTPPNPAGDVDVTVTTPNGTSTPPLTYTYIPPETPPTANDINPDEGPTDGGTTVTITGSDFVPGDTTVTIDDTTIPADQVTVDPSGDSLTFTTPPNDAGPVDVTVTTTDGTTDPLTYTYIAPDNDPTADDIDPGEGPTDGGTTVTIDGTNFVPGDTTVTINGTTIPADEVDVNDDGTSLTFTTPPHGEGPVGVTVTTPDGTTDPLIFTYTDGDDNGNGGTDGGNNNDGTDPGGSGNAITSNPSGTGSRTGTGSSSPSRTGSSSSGGQSSGSLAQTGSSSTGLVPMAMFGIIAGAALILRQRRRLGPVGR